MTFHHIDFYRHLLNKLKVGIVIMDEDRRIHYVNEKGQRMTGWEVGEKVPYCTYCQSRTVLDGQERCLLATEESMDYFQAEMPVYQGKYMPFEMRLSSMHLQDGKKMMVLMIKEPSEKETRQVRKLLIQETLLAQEAERKRISQELHDVIGQNVFSIYLGLQSLRPVINQTQYCSLYEKMEELLLRTITDLKQMSKKLRPPSLDMLGLNSAIEAMIDEWKSLYDVDITFKTDLKSERLDNVTELTLYRVIQECLHNAIRHGEANRIIIQLYEYGQYVYFRVCDNGKGFEYHPDLEAKGLGIRHMRERLQSVAGELVIESQTGGPTVIDGYVTIKSG
ncbi:PAS domain S-box protein [Caldalkalibacillus thermarum TA2.A1]|uniref:histidine kinase n=1 Tax=Caldalkalibacillus thermarum (strain TA2.A1) TaxID=986075 RepID=A0A8X8I7D3_CALTT|nr:histidine kinase [Caldalkalibacillus thermarum]QZT32897.1 PAS domain S-box protein [Caldalkalibacillus thermarum TA2.A1]